MAVASSPVRRDELRAFLRSRRARVSPADVGLPDDGARRRTPGLRREELAALAGVGVSWYTWLEQGRDIHPSPEVLDAVARALRLDGAERATLFALARTELPLPASSGALGEEADDGRAVLMSLVEGLHPTPAYLLGPMTRILAWNPAASALFGSPDHLSPERRSLLWMLLVDPVVARDNAGRKGTARNMVARFRSEYAQHAGEPAYEEFIAELHERSPWFAEWWGAHEVNDTQRGTKTIEHPTLGMLRLHHAQTVPTGAPDLRLTICAPADAATRVALAKLATP
ncbi:MAG TPA: helix-turn-helix transcriptional regulator [Solirubrobacteraceae bacterium]|jgi:transcriptional regulator with XRE-family HTH domain|nr:helix-turn-helix transcriptional regulator [Solirubrobacteraceae bacterium]